MSRAIFVRSILILSAVGVLTVSTARAVGPLSFYSVTPCRIADTRNPSNGQGTGGPALVALQSRPFKVTGLCGIPSTAKAVTLNVTIVSPTNSGHLTVFPYNTSLPLVSNINYTTGEPALANGAIVPLTTDPNWNISVFAGIPSGMLHLVLDVTGYFQ